MFGTEDEGNASNNQHDCMRDLRALYESAMDVECCACWSLVELHWKRGKKAEDSVIRDTLDYIANRNQSFILDQIKLNP